MFQTNPFDLFETFFGASMGGFSGMDQGSFRTSRRAAMRGEDVRLVLTVFLFLRIESFSSNRYVATQSSNSESCSSDMMWC
jgi:DnaJ-class molecular chaperone